MFCPEIIVNNCQLQPYCSRALCCRAVSLANNEWYIFCLRVPVNCASSEGELKTSRQLIRRHICIELYRTVKMEALIWFPHRARSKNPIFLLHKGWEVTDSCSTFMAWMGVKRDCVSNIFIKSCRYKALSVRKYIYLIEQLKFVH